MSTKPKLFYETTDYQSSARRSSVLACLPTGEPEKPG